MCYVTADKDTGKNKIVWSKTADQNTAGYNIYKDAVGGAVKIGTVAFDAPASFIDPASHPNAKTERYAIKAVDACGNESIQESYHKTVLLQASLGTTGEVNLTWNKYEGAPATKTIIYRGEEETALLPIAELTGQEDRYIDRAPATEEKIYRIGIELDANCGPGIVGGRLAATSVIAMSNMLNLQVTGLAEDYKAGSRLITIWPNPAAGNDVAILLDQSQPQPVNLQLLNATGQLVWQQAIASHSIRLKRNSLPAGLYIVALTLQNGKILKKKLLLL
ncbi:T9SS type A sorting domain-containing protein [Pontibacter chitinilyticus]|uniref:T9SS type A sorting domain-containing protein n=1 Tax=Pontibacter chitinilyticus TaxID=2674989 RepID=UPI00321A80DA